MKRNVCRICGEAITGKGVKYLGRVVHPRCKQKHSEHMKRKEALAAQAPDLMEKTRAAVTMINRVPHGRNGEEDLRMMYALTAFCGYSADDAARLVKATRRDKDKGG